MQHLLVTFPELFTSTCELASHLPSPGRHRPDPPPSLLIAQGLDLTLARNAEVHFSPTNDLGFTSHPPMSLKVTPGLTHDPDSIPVLPMASNSSGSPALPFLEGRMLSQEDLDKLEFPTLIFSASE